MISKANLSYCGREVWENDRDRFLTTLFAPPEVREMLLTLYAFNIEVSKTRDVVSNTMLGAIRLQWWRDVIEALYLGKSLSGHAVVEALGLIKKKRALSRTHFDKLIDGRMKDLENDSLETMEGLIEYVSDTSVPLIKLAMESSGGLVKDASLEAAKEVGISYALAGLMRAMPHHLSRNRIFLPNELLEKHRINRRQLLELTPSENLNLAIEELTNRALHGLRKARSVWRDVPKEQTVTLLPCILAETYLFRISRNGNNIFNPALQEPAGLAVIRLAFRAVIGRY